MQYTSYQLLLFRKQILLPSNSSRSHSWPLSWLCRASRGRGRWGCDWPAPPRPPEAACCPDWGCPRCPAAPCPASPVVTSCYTGLWWATHQNDPLWHFGLSVRLPLQQVLRVQLAEPELKVLMWDVATDLLWHLTCHWSPGCWRGAPWPGWTWWPDPSHCWPRSSICPPVIHTCTPGLWLVTASDWLMTLTVLLSMLSSTRLCRWCWELISSPPSALSRTLSSWNC